MLEHPTDPKYMKIYGRADDQIILSTGEKVRSSLYATLLAVTHISCLMADEPGADG